MPSRLLFTSLALTLLATAAADRASADDAEVHSALLRLAIVVSDPERSKRFYTEGFGYRVTFEGDITRPAVRTQLGLEDGQTAWFCVLASDNVVAGEQLQGAMIGLLAISNPSPPRLRRPDGADLAIGEGMLAVVTSDIRAVRERVAMLGARILLEPMRSPDGREWEMVLHDPDGVRIHVVERARSR
jgi:catechol 2,3-dioxygenase-like lactoylglutathione lyase family enzyme